MTFNGEYLLIVYQIYLLLYQITYSHEIHFKMYDNTTV